MYVKVMSAGGKPEIEPKPIDATYVFHFLMKLKKRCAFLEFLFNSWFIASEPTVNPTFEKHVLKLICLVLLFGWCLAW